MNYYPVHNRIYNIKSDSLDSPKIESNESSLLVSNKDIKPMTLPSTTIVNNPLSGLVAHYDSDSEHEDVNGQEPSKLDSKVDDFLEEINNLGAPEVKSKQESTTTSETTAWQECFDESTGFPYYWNISTNIVTWEMPTEYKEWLTRKKVSSSSSKPVVSDQTQDLKKNSTEIQPESKKITENLSLNNENVLKDSALDQSTVKNSLAKEKIVIKKEQKQPNRSNKIKKAKVQSKKSKPPTSDSEEEKIVMITSFSEETSSESENENTTAEADKLETTLEEEKPLVVLGPHAEDIPKDLEVASTSVVESNKIEIENIKDENIDETILLSRLRTQAKVLQELGGELPKSVDKSIISMDLNEVTDSIKPLSLVAGYGDDSEPEEDSPEKSTKSLFPIPIIPEISETSEQNESTLFPATKPIDIKQFEVPQNQNKAQTYTTSAEKENPESVVDNKVFKRKKRLGIAFDVVPTKAEKKIKLKDNVNEFGFSAEERKGFGFLNEDEKNDEKITDRVAFNKGGIAFVKSDTLNPDSGMKDDDRVESEDLGDFAEMKEIVSEKVSFLGEGKDPVSAVQVMSIQLQTLEAAYKAGGLSMKYLCSWLEETKKELEKLEQEAAPEGWQCQWDRSNKRYFYRNQQTGETQWEFPEADIVGGGEAMDICTTPPPPPSNDEPPTSRTPTPPPPPPPLITLHLHTDELQPPIPTLPPPVEIVPPPPPIISVSENQPLPPGVDSSDLPYFAVQSIESSSERKVTGKDALGSELDSFYSDIAMLEATNVTSTDTAKSDIENVTSPASIGESIPASDIVLKKKKKPKAKLGQGLNMKKKAVSSLVEKWKKVQNDYL